LGDICNAIGRCLNFICIRPITWLCTQLWRGTKAVCEAIWDVMSFLGTWLVVKPLKALWACVSAVSSFMYEEILAPIGRGVWWALSALASGVWAVMSFVGRGFRAVARGIWAALRAVGRAIRDVFA
jgi:hypothetical protein